MTRKGDPVARAAALALDLEPKLRARLVLAPAVLSRDEYALGVSWYWREAQTLHRLAAELRLPAETVVAAAATLSPGNGWRGFHGRLHGFLVAALAGEHEPPFPTYGANRRKAAAIVRARAGLAAVTGPKVRAFASNLWGDCRPVTIDRHVARMVAGRETLSAVERRATQLAFERVARVAGLRPCKLQSLLWTAAVGLEGKTGPRKARP